MAGLVPAIHVFKCAYRPVKDVDARDERGHDGEETHVRESVVMGPRLRGDDGPDY
jgi:hypothetical protein